MVVEGQDVTLLSSFERARAGVLLVPEARGIFPGLSVEENLKVLLESDADREKAYERFPILGDVLTETLPALDKKLAQWMAKHLRG